RIEDDRDTLKPGDKLLLIVEDDPNFARILINVARSLDFKVIVTGRGSEALSLAADHNPTAISLDIFLPDMLGWTVLSHLKRRPLARHIPVQITTLADDRQHGLSRGAYAFVSRPSAVQD